MWGENLVVFHPPTSSTQLINLLAHDTLNCLDVARTIDTLIHLLAPLYLENSSQELETALRNTLHLLHENDLIEQLH
jgi:hypothetical protein